MRSCRWAERPSPAARTAAFSGKDGTCPVKADKAHITRLLKTARGHIDGVLRMVDDDKYCIDIANQIMAAEAILRKANKEIIRAHLEGCVKDAFSSGSEERMERQIEEILNVMDSLGK